MNDIPAFIINLFNLFLFRREEDDGDGQAVEEVVAVSPAALVVSYLGNQDQSTANLPKNRLNVH